jgi:hypothetical protein
MSTKFLNVYFSISKNELHILERPKHFPVFNKMSVIFNNYLIFTKFSLYNILIL